MQRLMSAICAAAMLTTLTACADTKTDLAKQAPAAPQGPATASVRKAGMHASIKDEIVAELLTVKLVTPSYRHTLYSTQPDKSITVELSKRAESLGTTNALNIELRSSTGEVVRKGKLFKAGTTAVLDGAGLAAGEYLIEATIPGPANSGILKQTLPLRVLPPAPREVYFDRDGITYINGKPTFVLGLYGMDVENRGINADNLRLKEPLLTQDRPFDVARDLGFNTVVAFTWIENDNFADLAEKRGLYVIRVANDAPGKWEPVVRRLRNHKAIIAWAPWDEPHSPEDFELATGIATSLGELDPYRPTQVAQCYSDMFGATARLADIVSLSTYPLAHNEWWKTMDWWRPEWKSPMRNISRYLEQAQAAASPGQPVWLIVQIHGGKTVTPLPTPAQIRLDAYMAIVAGTRGMLFYAYSCPDVKEENRNFWLEKHPEIMAATKSVVGEIKTLEPMLLAAGGAAVVNVDGSSDIKALIRTVGAEQYLVVVNISDDAQTLKFNLAKRASKIEAVFAGDPALQLNGTVITGTLPAQSAAAYRLKP